MLPLCHFLSLVGYLPVIPCHCYLTFVFLVVTDMLFLCYISFFVIYENQIFFGICSGSNLIQGAPLTCEIIYSATSFLIINFFLQGLTIRDLEDLLEDIKVYLEMEKHTNLEFWKDITTITEDELAKLRKIDPESQSRYF